MNNIKIMLPAANLMPLVAKHSLFNEHIYLEFMPVALGNLDSFFQSINQDNKDRSSTECH